MYSYSRGLILIAVALVLGIVIIAIVRLPGSANGRHPAAALPRPGIVVAAGPLKFGDRLSADNLRLAAWPRDAVPIGAYTRIDDALGQARDRVAVQSIEPGEAVLAEKISVAGAHATFSSIITDDMRAVTLHVNDTTDVAGFVLPNDRVDVLLTRPRQLDSQTEILLQNIKVLAIDQVTQRVLDQDKEKKTKNAPIQARVVTVEVSPNDAGKLVLAQQVGTLSLALRNAASAQEVAVSGVFGSTLAPTRPGAASTEAAAPARPVTILRGAVMAAGNGR